MPVGANERLGISLQIEEVTGVDALSSKIEKAVADAGAKARPTISLSSATFDAAGLEQAFQKLFSGLAKSTSPALQTLISQLSNLSTAAKETQATVNSQIGSIAQRMASSLGIEKSTEEFKKLKAVIAEAFQFRGLDEGITKVVRTKDLMVQLNGVVYNVARDAEQLKKLGDIDFSKALVWDGAKLKRDVEAFAQSLQAVRDKATLNREASSYTVAAKGPLPDSRQITTPQQLVEAKKAVAEFKTALDYDITTSKLYTTLAALQERAQKVGISTRAQQMFADDADVVSGRSVAGSAATAASVRDLAGVVAWYRTEVERAEKAQKALLSDTKFDTSVERMIRKYAELRNSLVMFNANNPTSQLPLPNIPAKGSLGSPLDLEKARQEYNSFLSFLKTNSQSAALDLSQVRFNLKQADVSRALDNLNNDLKRWAGSDANRISLAAVIDTTKVDLSKIVDASSLIQVRAEVAKLINEFRNLKAAEQDAAKAEVDRSLQAARQASAANTWGKGISMFHQEAMASEYMASLAKKGQNIWNGQVVSSREYNQSLKDLAGTAETTGSAFGKLFTHLTEVYSIRNIVYAVGGEFRQAFAAALDLNQAVHDIIAIAGGSSSEFRGISASIYDIAKSSRLTTQEVASLMQVLAQAGIASKDLAAVSKEVGKFATATASDPKVAADVTTTAMETFNIRAQDTTRITNAMTAALNLSKLETSGLATAFNYLAPQAAQLGMTLEQTLAIISNMAQSGVKASTIGTGVSQLLKEFSAPKQRLKDMLKEFKLTPEDINPITNNFADIVQKLQDSGVTVDRLFQALETRVGRAAVAAINLSAESFRNMEANLTGTQAALVAYSESMQGARARMNVAKQEFQELSTILGMHLAPTLIKVVGGIRDLIAVFSADNGRWAKFGFDLLAVAAGMGMVYSASKALVGLNLVSSFLAVGPALRTVYVALGEVYTGVTSLRLAWQGLSVAVQTSIASAGVGLVLLGIGLAINKLMESTRKAREETEAAEKATAQRIAAEERMHQTLNNLAHKNKEVSDEYSKYLKLVRQGASEEKALSQIKDVKVTADKEQIAVYKEYLEKGGAHSKYMDAIIEQKGSLKDLILYYRELRTAQNQALMQKVDTYNAKYTEYEKNKEQGVKYQEYEIRKEESGKPKNSRLTDTQVRSEAEKRSKAKFQKENPSPYGEVYQNERTGDAVAIFTTDNEGKGLWSAIEQPKKPNTKPPEDKTKQQPVDQQAAATTLELQNKREDLKKANRELKDIKLNEEAYLAQLKEVARIEDEIAILSGEKAEYSTLAGVTNKGWLAAQSAADKDKTNYQVLMALGDPAKIVEALKKSGALLKEAGTKAQLELLQHNLGEAQQLSKKKAAADEVERDAKLKVFREGEERFWERVRQITNDAEKKAAQDELTRLEAEIGSAYTTEEVRQRKLVEARLKATQLVYSENYRKIQELQQELRDAFAAQLPAEQTNKIWSALNALMKGVDEQDRSRQRGLSDSGLKGSTAALERQARIDTQNLQNQRSLLEMRKEDAATADEVRALSNQQLAVDVQLAETKVRRLQDEKDFVDAEIERVGLTRENALEVQNLSNHHATLLEQLQQENYRLEQQKKKYQDATSEGPLDWFKSGVNKGQKAAGDPQANTEALGAKLYTTTIDGITTSITGMIDALGKGQNAWKSFRQGVGNMLQSLTADIQTYIVKLLVVKALKSVIGWTTNSDGTGWANQLFSSAKSSGTGATPKAEGGFIPLSAGRQGVDSVPALLMPGEYVIRKSVVDQYGIDYFHRLNAQKFAEGGLAGPGYHAPQDSGSGVEKKKDGDVTLNIINVVDPRTIPKTTGSEILNVIAYDAAQNGPTFRTLKARLEQR